MGGDDDARVLAVVADDGVEDVVARGGVHTADGLVEQVELGFAAHDQDELHLFFHALGHLADPLLLRKAEAREHVRRLLPVKIGIEIAVEVHELLCAHPLGQAGPVGQIAHERLALLPRLKAADRDLPRRRREQAVYELDERGLAAAVRSQQAHHAARHDAEIHPVERRLYAEVFCQVPALKTTVHCRPPLRCPPAAKSSLVQKSRGFSSPPGSGAHAQKRAFPVPFGSPPCPL